MAMFIDKYRPNKFSSLSYNRDQAECLVKMLRSNDFPHMLIYGSPGAGKRTRIQCILREVFGNSVEKTRIQNMIIETPTKKKLEFNVLASNFHVECNPSDLGYYDKFVIQDLIKKMAQSGGLVSSVPFKIVVVSDAHKLTREAQHSLRRTMEKYMSSIRLILNAETSSPILPPIKSRCLLLRVAAPLIETISSILSYVAKKENLSVSEEILKKIAHESERNLRRALLMLETMHINQTKDIIKPSYILFIQKMAKKMVEKPNLETIKDLRNDFFELEEHLIPTDTMFKILIRSLLQLCETPLKAKLLSLASHYEHQMRLGSKRIIHFESFAQHFISAYRKFTAENLIDDDDDLMEV